MATSKQDPAAADKAAAKDTTPDPEQQAEAEAKVQEQADKDRDEVAKAAQEAEGTTPVPANFEDIAAQARVVDEQAAQQAKDSGSNESDGKPDAEARK